MVRYANAPYSIQAAAQSIQLLFGQHRNTLPILRQLTRLQ